MTPRIRLMNFYNIKIWYPIAQLLGRLGLMQKCILCGMVHRDPLYSDYVLENSETVQICHYCGDMSHEPEFDFWVNNAALGLRKCMWSPETDRELYNVKKGKYVVYEGYWVLATEIWPS